MSAALNLSPCAPAVASVGASASVAVSCLESTMTDAKHLLALGCACRRAAGAFAIHAARLAVEVERGEHPDTGAAAEMAQRALDLEHAAQHLQAQAQDADWLTLQHHRDRFPLLLRMLAEMDRGVTFVPVAADALPAPRSVVVVGQDNAAARSNLAQRVGRGLARLKQRAS
ncbi:MAG: hypothetical protein MIL41_22705 [Hyphomicrobiales bacterium]